jgi:predicted O-methyltransferase YrrM
MSMPVDEDRLARVRRERRALAASSPARSRAELDFERVALPGDEGDVLRDLLCAAQARVVIEVGLAYGSSALAIAEALASSGSDDTHHLIIDPFQDHFHEAGWEALVRAGVADTCTLLPERSQLALPRLVADGVVADAAFVDGSHIFHNVFVDLYFLRELVCPGGLVVLDDCTWPSVATAVAYFETNASWRREPIDAPSRLRAYRLPKPRTEPSFENFQPFGPEAVL